MKDGIFNRIKTRLSIIFLLRNGYLTANSPDNLKSNPKVVKASIKKNPKSLDYALDDALTEENIKLAIEKGYSLSESSPEVLRSNPKVVEASVKNFAFTLDYALETGVTEKIVELAIDNGYSLMEMSDKPIPDFLRNNPKIVEGSIKRSLLSIRYALDGGLTEENIKLAIEKGYSLSESSSEVLRSNPKVINAYVNMDVSNIDFALDRGLTEENIKLAVEKGYILNFRSSEVLRNSPDVINAYVNMDASNIEFALDGGLTEENIKLAVEKGYILSDYSSEVFRSNPEVIKICVDRDTCSINYALEGGLTEENIYLAIEKGYLLDKNSSNILRSNPKMVKLSLDKYLGDGILSEEEIESAIRTGYVLTNDCFDILNLEMLSSNKVSILSEYFKILDPKLRTCFKDYIIEFQNNLDMGKIKYASDVLLRLSLSNSSELSAFGGELASQILKSDNPLEKLETIEEMFIRNNIPSIGKIYSCFEILHPDFKGFDFDNSKVSPVLKKSSTMAKKVIVFSDLIKASFGSNNKSVNEYLRNIEIASNLYDGIKIGQIQYDELSDIEKDELVIFSKHLTTLYNNTMKGKKEVFLSTNDALQDISKLALELSPNGTLDYNLGDRVIKMFCGFAGIDTLEQAKNYINEKLTTANFRNRNAANSEMILSQGDFIKGIGKVDYLRNILQNGSVSKEYLGASAGSDATPLDTDVSMILKSDGTIQDKISSTVANDYGPIWFVLKNDDRFINTRNDNETLDVKRDLSKLETFYTGVLGKGHYGIRTGFASSEIDYIFMDDYDPRVGLEIAMNGFYIPVANKEGKIIFTPNDYDKLREKMSGLSYFGEYDYKFSENLVTEETRILASQIAQSSHEVSIKRTKINEVIKDAVEGIGLYLKTTMDGDLTEGFVELIDTGSTGRGTNKPGDGDFDFMMRLDSKLLSNPSKLNELKQAILKRLGKENSSELTGNGDFRLKDVKIDENTDVDIDITFAKKSDKISYSTDMALQDRLSTIYRIDQEKYKYVVANILLAKQVLKKAEVYKPSRGEIPQGGLGGVGIENWILQNGGSFLDAAKSFVEAADGKSFEEFKSIYQIWDFGDNHMFDRNNSYPHDNFVANNMSESGYKKMFNVLKEYINNYEINNSSKVADKMIEAMVNGSVDVDGNFIVDQQLSGYSGRTMGFTGMQLVGLVSCISSIIIALFGIVFLFITS